MSLSPRLERARVDLEALATRDVPLAELVDLLHRRFVRAVPSAAGYFLTVDPSTMLPTGGVVQGFPAEACAPFWRAEFTGDLLPFAELAQADLAGSLHDTPPSALRASERYASLLQPAGMHDELRVAFVAGGSCWGVGGWVRRADAAPFRDEEVELARRISEPVARGLRGRMLMEQSECPDHDMAMLLLDGEGRVQSRNRNLDAWLDELSTVQGIDDGELPSLMNLLAAQAVAVQAQGRGPDPCVRVRGRSGRWATVRASALQGGHAAVAIVIQAAEATADTNAAGVPEQRFAVQ